MNAPPLALPDPGRVAARPGQAGLFLALAPMDGVTDGVYRDLLTGLYPDSGISLCVSEFVRVTRDPVPSRVIERTCPEVRSGGKTRAGVPVFVQLLGGVPEPMAETAITATELGAPGIDINFGCPAKTVNNHDGGAAILRNPDRVEAITRAIRDAVKVPVTVKIRAGWKSCQEVGDIARAAAAGGADWLTIHARTKSQGYRPPVHWDALGRAQSAVRIPVVANGDLHTTQAVRRCAAVSGCTAFMLGRGAMGRPDLFRQVRGWTADAMDLDQFTAILLDYADRLVETGAPERAAVGRIKQWLRLAALSQPETRSLFDETKRLAELPELRNRLADYGGNARVH